MSSVEDKEKTDTMMREEHGVIWRRAGEREVRRVDQPNNSQLSLCREFLFILMSFLPRRAVPVTHEIEVHSVMDSEIVGRIQPIQDGFKVPEGLLCKRNLQLFRRPRRTVRHCRET